ncbi:MAG: alcohol dehydrogenase catalytic domain-containing protein [Chloroflexi bacterium]|nr:alcohol dehydrogenase catalytic domain-containing protein [Chloroflexota bacterium]MCL5075927.1 alcohol dehydrogenase catalytic domain-containing protein [Chloroflexota bacterium]
MKVALLNKPGEFILEERECPRLGSTDVLVKVVVCGICGTDIGVFEGEKPVGWKIIFPFQMGHELSGVIEDVGSEVPDLRRGNRVVPDGRVVCGRCHYCRLGMYNLCMNQSYIASGFAEYGVYPYRNLVNVPDGVPLDAAAFTESLACCVNGNNKLKDVPLGGVGVVIGAGPIGLMHTQLLRHRGLDTVVVDVQQTRLEVAKKVGATVTINGREKDVVKEVLAFTDGRGADVVVSAAGQDVSVLDQALAMAAKQGQILYFAAVLQDRMELSLDVIHYKELHLVGSHDCTIGQYEAALALLKAGVVRVEPLISDRFPLDQIQKAFEVARQRRGMKVLVVNS